nr:MULTISPECIES: SIR2 family protein [unclassified Bradyrhizobium]
MAYCAAQAARQRAAGQELTDADYVEVLTEIGIQTPVPNPIKERRNGRSFLFFGCRFNDRLCWLCAADHQTLG